MRATKIMPADRWTKKSQKALLGSPVEASLYKSEQETERDRAFDLLVRTPAHSRADLSRVMLWFELRVVVLMRMCGVVSLCRSGCALALGRAHDRVRQSPCYGRRHALLLQVARRHGRPGQRESDRKGRALFAHRCERHPRHASSRANPARPGGPYCCAFRPAPGVAAPMRPKQPVYVMHHHDAAPESPLPLTFSDPSRGALPVSLFSRRALFRHAHATN